MVPRGVLNDAVSIYFPDAHCRCVCLALAHRLLQGRDGQRDVQGARGRADTAGCAGCREAKRVRGCVGRLWSPIAPLPCDPNSGCGPEQRAAKSAVSSIRNPANAPPRHPDRHCATAVLPLTILFVSPALTRYYVTPGRLPPRKWRPGWRVAVSEHVVCAGTRI
jgi:hypothetical protein